MRQSLVKQYFMLCLLGLSPSLVMAAGLGKLNVSSSLGEPLSAEIEVLSASADDIATMKASIAAADAYAQQGIERPNFHNAIRLDLRKKADGNAVIKLSTAQAVNDPFVDMLVQVEWANGKLVREFTILLDPPDYRSANEAAVNNANINNPSIEAAKPIARVEKTAPEVKTDNAAAEADADNSAPKPQNIVIHKRAQKPAKALPVANDTEADADGKSSEAKSLVTKRGDTLIAFARAHQVSGVNLDQMLASIYRANKSAFQNQNMNRLKVGQIIRIPPADELQAISAGAAHKEVRVHTQDWDVYRKQLAESIAAAPNAKDETRNRQAATGKIIGKTEDEAKPENAGERDVVKLSKGDLGLKKATGNSAENASNGAQSAQEKLSALQEETVANEKRLKDANERTGLLEKQVNDMQKLLQIKSQALADMQKQVQEKTAEPKVDAAKPSTELAQPAEPAKPKAEKPAVQITAKPAVPSKDTWATYKELILAQLSAINSTLLAGAGAGVLALLAALWLVRRKKRQPKRDSFDKQVLNPSDLKANTVFANDATDTEFLNDFNQKDAIDAADADAIAEAEVYLAYGRDRQAEEIIKEALLKAPKRGDLHIKLLEIYAAREDASAFENAATQLHDALGVEDAAWAKAVEMGQQLDPENPLYQHTATPAAVAETVAAAAALSAFDAGEPEGSPAPSQARAQVLDDEADDDSLSFDDEESQLKNPEAVLDFDLAALAPDILAEPEVEAQSAAKTVVDSSIFSKDEVPSFVSDKEPAPATAETPEIVPEAPATQAATTSATAAEAELDEDILDFDQTESAAIEVNELDADDAPDFASPSIASSPVASASSLGEIEEVDMSLAADVPDDDEDNLFAAEPAVEKVEPEAEIKLEPKAELKPEVIPEQIKDISFDLDLDDTSEDDTPEPKPVEAKPAAAKAGSEAEPAVTELDLSGINLDLSTGDDATDFADLAEPSDVDTKLDLVTAYIDMGDTEGAKELLAEVLAEGGPNQRARAEQILSSMA